MLERDDKLTRDPQWTRRTRVDSVDLAPDARLALIPSQVRVFTGVLGSGPPEDTEPGLCKHDGSPLNRQNDSVQAKLSSK